jgi:hypothetical protein
MSQRTAWLALVLSVCTVVVCFGQASAARDVPEVRMRRVCVAGVRVDLSGEAEPQGTAAHGERRPTATGDPCGPQAAPLGIPGARLGETDGVIGRFHDSAHSRPRL